MSKYIVKDWVGNVMNWGEFTHFDYANEAIAMHVLKEMSNDDHDIVWPEDGGNFDENVFNDYCDEYYIDEV